MFTAEGTASACFINFKIIIIPWIHLQKELCWLFSFRTKHLLEAK